jgi:hypothetical protein
MWGLFLIGFWSAVEFSKFSHGPKIAKKSTFFYYFGWPNRAEAS